MSISGIVAAAALLLGFFPQPLMWLERVFVRVLARSVARATEGSVDVPEATDRIRRAERLEPRDSTRLFAAVVFLAACAAGIFTEGLPTPVSIMIVVLGPLTGLLIMRMDYNQWNPFVAALTGVACVVAVL